MIPEIGQIALILALMLALWTGQRQGDLLRLPWSAYDGTRIRLRQSKGGVQVVVPVGKPLKLMLDATKRSIRRGLLRVGQRKLLKVHPSMCQPEKHPKNHKDYKN